MSEELIEVHVFTKSENSPLENIVFISRTTYNHFVNRFVGSDDEVYTLKYWNSSNQELPPYHWNCYLNNVAKITTNDSPVEFCSRSGGPEEGCEEKQFVDVLIEFKSSSSQTVQITEIVYQDLISKLGKQDTYILHLNGHDWHVNLKEVKKVGLKNICKDCLGEGQFLLLNSFAKCKTCNGTGR